jgi:iron complex transport system substrate-binding protein
MKVHHLFAAAVLAFAAPATAAEPAPLPDTSRLVVVGGSLLEIVYALGEEEKLVGRDSTGLYPPEAAALPDVGYMRALSPEGVLSVNPSALIVAEGSGPPEALDVLTKGALPYVTVPDNYSHEGILAKVRYVGVALGAEEKAERLAAELDRELRAAEELTRSIPEPNRKRVLFIISAADGRIRAAGSGTAADGIIGLAGGINPLQGMHGYQTLTDEALLEASPDLILTMNNGGPGGDLLDQIQAHPILAQSPAIRDGKLVSIDASFLLGFGPRTPAAIRELARTLYDDLPQS